MNGMTQDDHDELGALLRNGLSEDDLSSTLEGLGNPYAKAAAGALPEAASDSMPATSQRPGSIPAQVAQATMGATQRPRVDTSKPLGYTPPRDTELEALQAKAKAGRNEARLGQSVADFANRPSNFLDYAQRLGGGGTSAPMKSPNLLAGNAEEPQQDIADLQASRKSGAAMATAAEDDNPNSDFANAYRSVILKFAPELANQLKNANPRQMRAMAPMLEKFAISEAAKTKGKKTGSDTDSELTSYKAVMSKQYPKYADAFNALTSMKGAQDLQNAAEGDLTRASNERVGTARSYREEGFRKEDKATATAEANRKRIEDEAEKMANEMKGRGVMKKRLADLDAAIPRVGTIPGTGIIGDAVAWFDSKAGTDFQSPEAIKVRQNIGLLMAAILREQSGATVSEQEYARAVQNGLSTKNAATTREALKRLNDEFAIGEKEIKSKYTPEAKKVYESRASQSETAAKPSPGPGYVRSTVNGAPGWVNEAAGEWEPD